MADTTTPRRALSGDPFGDGSAVAAGQTYATPTPKPVDPPAPVAPKPPAQLTQDQQNILASIQAVFSGYGINSLYAKIEQYVRDGYNADTISLMLRQTPEYAARFPAMATLNAKGRGISEAAYLDYERTAAQLEKQYGLPQGMLTGNVTGMLEKDISASEMLDRVKMSVANSYNASPELKKALHDYYGIDGNGIAAYFVDPDIAEPLLQKQAASAAIGAAALQQDLNVNVLTAEQLQQLGVSAAQAQQGFGQVAGMKELFSGSGDTVSQDQAVQGVLAGDQAALQDVNRAAGGRKARFEQGGDILATQAGMSGLQSAATT